MQRKQLVKRDGKWVEVYVDCGPGKALLGHGRTLMGTQHASGRKLSAPRTTERGR